jgi:uncharacterized protein (TIRG00374 family)
MMSWRGPSLLPRRVWRWLAVLIPAGILANVAVLVVKTDRSALASLASFSPPYLFLAAGLSFVPWLTNTLRIRLWTRFLGHHSRLSDMFQVVLGTELGSAVTPTSGGGGYVKLWMLTQMGFSPGKAASLMILGSVEDTVFFGLALFFACTFTTSLREELAHLLGARFAGAVPVIAGVAGLLGVGMGLVWLCRRRLGRSLTAPGRWARWRIRLRCFLKDFASVYKTIGRKGKWLFGLTVLLTAIQWLCRYSVVLALLASFRLPIRFVHFFVLQWVVFTIMTVAPTPGGAIAAEGAFLLVYRNHIPPSVIGLVAAGWRFMTFYLQLTIGSVLFGCRQLRARERRPSESG